MNGLATQSSYNAAGGSHANISYNPDGSLAGVVAYDVNTGQTITTTSSQRNLVDFINIDHIMNQNFGNGLGGVVFDSWNNFVSNSLLTYAPTQQIILFVPGYNPADPYGLGLNLAPIGAFYESVTPALDLAQSIADKTPVLLDANNQGMSVTALTARDTNLDGQLTGAELTGLNTWIDANENGQLETGELRSLTTAGISQIKSADYSFYTQGNAVMGTGVAAETVRPNEATGVPAAIAAQATPVQPLRINLTQTVPASNYATLRATDNLFFVVGGYLGWAPTQIKINYSNQSYLIGTDGADNFDASYYAAYTQYFNSGLLTNFLAGGGNDVFGGSIRADSLWGGLGNDCEAANDAVFEMRRRG